MRLDTHEKNLNDAIRNQEINQLNNPNIVTEIKDNETQPIQFPSVRPHLLNPETENFIIGSRIISRKKNKTTFLVVWLSMLIQVQPLIKWQENCTHTKANIYGRFLSRMEKNSLMKQRSINVKNHFEQQTVR